MQVAFKLAVILLEKIWLHNQCQVIGVGGYEFVGFKLMIYSGHLISIILFLSRGCNWCIFYLQTVSLKELYTLNVICNGNEKLSDILMRANFSV